MTDENSSKNKTKWIIAGALGVAVLGGGIALAVSGKGNPTTVEWYGYQIRIENRELEEESAGGKPYRWVVARDEQLLGTGLAESEEIAIDAAKSAVERVAQSSTPQAPQGGMPA